MSVDKFGRRGIEDKSDVSLSFINKTFLRRDGGNTVTGSIDVGGNTFHNVDIPRSVSYTHLTLPTNREV